MKDYSLRNEKSRLIQATATSLHEHITELFDNGYDQGYADATIDLAHEESDRAYQQGLEDAWKAARKLALSSLEGGLDIETVAEIFDGLTYYYVLKDVPASEAIAKIKAYEEQHKQDTEIKVGDEVVLNGNASYENEKAIILAYDGKSYPYNVLMSNGDTEWVKEDSIEYKTGRHFDAIAEVLAEMRGEK